MPYLSVVIPLFNKEKQIEQTVISVLSQAFSDFELIIINDGSTDASLEIVSQIKDDRIRIISQPNSGVSFARNRGISESQGEYIFFMDADDLLLPGAFSVLDDVEKTNVIVAGFIQTNQEGMVTRQVINKIDGIVEYPFKAFCHRDILLRMGNFFIQRDFVDKIGGLRTDFSLYEDLEWNIRILKHATVLSSTSIILNYNRGNCGLSHGFKPIEIDYAYEASVKNATDKYEQIVIGSFVFRRFVNRLKMKDWKGVKRIWSNNSWRMLFCMISFIYRSFQGDYIKEHFKK